MRLMRELGKRERLAIASVTRMEIHAGMLEDERYVTQRLLSRFVTLPLDEAVADRAGDLLRTARERGAALSVPDAIIAATALTHNLILVTFNPGDFQWSGLSLYPLDLP